MIILLLLIELATLDAWQRKPAAIGPIRLFVYASRPTTGFVLPSQKDRDDSAKDLTRALKFAVAPQWMSLKPRLAVVVKTKETAEIVIDIVGREAKTDDIRIVRAVMAIGDTTVEIEGMDDDADWSDAAGNLCNRIVAWLTNNRERIPRRAQSDDVR